MDAKEIKSLIRDNLRMCKEELKDAKKGGDPIVSYLAGAVDILKDLLFSIKEQEKNSI